MQRFSTARTRTVQSPLGPAARRGGPPRADFPSARIPRPCPCSLTCTATISVEAGLPRLWPPEPAIALAVPQPAILSVVFRPAPIAGARRRSNLKSDDAGRPPSDGARTGGPLRRLPAERPFSRPLVPGKSPTMRALVAVCPRHFSTQRSLVKQLPDTQGLPRAAQGRSSISPQPAPVICAVRWRSVSERAVTDCFPHYVCAVKGGRQFYEISCAAEAGPARPLNIIRAGYREDLIAARPVGPQLHGGIATLCTPAHGC